MSSRRLVLLQGQRLPLLLQTSSLLPSLGRLRYSSGSKEDGSEGIMQKARSTAEEFSRQAKEKSDSARETAKEVWDDAKEAVAGETQSEKEKFKERIERGNYDRIGRD